MTIRGVKYLIAAVLLALIGVFVSGAHSQPRPVNPVASAVSEQQLLLEFGRVQGLGSIPDVKSYVVEQPAGRKWRTFHEVYLHWVAGLAIVGIVFLLAVFYLWRGTLHFKGGWSGLKMVRFSAFERCVHWLIAVSFIILAITGLNITFGKKLLLPLLGLEAFSTWSQIAKYAHNFLSLPFTIGVGLIFLIWVASNLPTRADIEWIKQGGGMFGGDEPPCYRFNPGEKLIFWITVIGGGLVAASGYMLLFPFYGTGILSMQIAQVVHSTVGVLYIAGMLVHVYMGTLGTEGAFEGMATGEVDVNWAKTHHLLWFEEEMVAAGKGKSGEV